MKSSKTKAKILSAVMAMAMVASMGMPAFAADPPTSGGQGATVTTPDTTGETPVSVDAEAATFDVTVPLALPVTIDKDGVATTATDAKIENNGAGPVLVKGVDIAPDGDWNVVKFDSDFSTTKVGSHLLGFKLNNEATGEDGKFTFDQADYPSIAGAGNLGLTYDARVPAQDQAITDATVAHVTFTVGWDTAEEAPVG